MLRPWVALGALVLVIAGSIVAVMALARPPSPSPSPSIPPASGVPSATASTAPSGGTVAPPVGITFPDFAVETTVVRSPTTSTAQSKLWYADGRWWGALFGPTTNRLGIFTLDPKTQVWADTGTLIDERAGSPTRTCCPSVPSYGRCRAGPARRTTTPSGSGASAMTPRRNGTSLDPDFPVDDPADRCEPRSHRRRLEGHRVGRLHGRREGLDQPAHPGGADVLERARRVHRAGGGGRCDRRCVDHLVRSGPDRCRLDEPALQDLLREPR